MEDKMTDEYTRQELNAVIKWLKERAGWLNGERMIIECGDDFAAANGKWPGVIKLRSEEQAISVSLRVARDQLDELDTSKAYLDASKGGETTGGDGC
jgi:hypothetical protein